jgi:hypothetical protein
VRTLIKFHCLKHQLIYVWENERLSPVRNRRSSKQNWKDVIRTSTHTATVWFLNAPSWNKRSRYGSCTVSTVVLYQLHRQYRRTVPAAPSVQSYCTSCTVSTVVLYQLHRQYSRTVPAAPSVQSYCTSCTVSTVVLYQLHRQYRRTVPAVRNVKVSFSVSKLQFSH